MRVEYDDLSMLRLCSYDELSEAVRVLVPYTKETAPCAIDFSGMSLTETMRASVTLRTIAMRLLGSVLIELEHRHGISDATYEREWHTVHQDLMGKLDAALAATREPV